MYRVEIGTKKKEDIITFVELKLKRNVLEAEKFWSSGIKVTPFTMCHMIMLFSFSIIKVFFPFILRIIGMAWSDIDNPVSTVF